jgi:hypothetical protein
MGCFLSLNGVEADAPRKRDRDEDGDDEDDGDGDAQMVTARAGDAWLR